ncbi:hypothetical protein [Roseateles sp. LYH14W]|uniref:DUF1570 domain-containing protein n=1 Tax=Pelomonas parva TaxID=3299032 RepID=A0ABW7FEB5_9BURK
MKNCGTISALLVLALLWALPAGAAQWLRAESPHFRVLARNNKSILQDRVQDLERLHSVMLLTLGVSEGQAPPRPPFEIAMKDDEAFIADIYPHLRDRAAGVFSSSVDGARAFAAVRSFRGSRDGADKVLSHEYAHRVMAQYARIRYPAWYVEGFASYFGATRIDSEGVEVGAADAGRLWVLKERPWLEPAQLLQPGFEATGQKGIDDSRFDAFYAQGWLLTHYLLSDSGRTQRFNDYFRRIAAGEDAVAAFEPATGIALNRLNDELRRHSAELFAARIPASALPAVTVQVTELTVEQAESELDAMIIATRPQAEHGKAVLQRLQGRVDKAGGEKAPEAMRWALAYAEILYGDADRALLILAPWARQEEAPFEANRLLGLAWFAEAARSKGAEEDEAFAQARAFMMRAYKQRRNDAPTLYWLARLLYVKGPSASLSNAAEAASALEPQIAEYARLAVDVHLKAGHRDKAVRPLQAMANNPHGGALTERARAALQALQANEDAERVLTLLYGSKQPALP